MFVYSLPLPLVYLYLSLVIHHADHGALLHFNYTRYGTLLRTQFVRSQRTVQSAVVTLKLSFTFTVKYCRVCAAVPLIGAGSTRFSTVSFHEMCVARHVMSQKVLRPGRPRLVRPVGQVNYSELLVRLVVRHAGRVVR